MAKAVLQALSVAVIGGGWAGCAAAVELARAGHAATVYEAARTLGGRARKVEREAQDKLTVLDNGQHILLGAYTETLRLLKLSGQDPSDVILDLPLQMRYPDGSGGMDFIAPRWPAPLHLAWALLRAKGLARADKVALMRFQVARAQKTYDEAFALLPAEDRRAQRPGLIMAAIYRTLLNEVERDGYHVLKQRISLTPIRKLWLAWKTWVRG